MFKKSRKNYRALLILGIMIELLAIVYFAMPLFLHTPVAFIVIKSNSMLPELRECDMVVISGLNKDLDKFINKIVAFYDPTQGKIIVHRVISTEDNSLITKGDNVDTIDFFQPTEKYILGKVLFKDKH